MPQLDKEPSNTRSTNVIAIFVGAGFSAPASVPLASQLFDKNLEVDRVTRQWLMDRVLEHWELWRPTNAGSPGIQPRAIWFCAISAVNRLQFNIGRVLQLTGSHSAAGARVRLGSPRESPDLHSTLRSWPIVQ
jgi:hypothetical protein